MERMGRKRNALLLSSYRAGFKMRLHEFQELPDWKVGFKRFPL